MPNGTNGQRRLALCAGGGVLQAPESCRHFGSSVARTSVAGLRGTRGRTGTVTQLLVGVQVLNGILLPIILVFILLLINDKRLTGDLKNNRRNNVLAFGTLILITTAVVVMLGAHTSKQYVRIEGL